MIPHFPYGRTRRVQALATEPEPTPAATTETPAKTTYAQMLQSLREAPPTTRALTSRPPIDPITQIARAAADAYDKTTGHDWTEYGLIDAVLAAVTPAIRKARR